MPAPRPLIHALALILFCLSALAGGAQAQIAAPAIQPILVMSQERLLRESRTGQRLLASEEKMLAEHRNEGQQLDQELEQEERDLTEMRDTMAADDFAVLAEEFDQKVVKVRLDHQAKSEKLGDVIDANRQAFFQQLVPIVAQIMQRRGASLVFERRSVLFTGPNVDITPEVIDVMDKAAGFD